MEGRDGLGLDLNENTAGCSPRVAARLRALTARDLALYPDRDAGERLLANFLNIDSSQVLLTNGVDEALYILASAYISEGEEMMFADPTFVMYPHVGQSVGAKLTRLRMASDFAFPTDALIHAITPHTRLIAIANPNNPTGLPVPRADLLRIVEAAPDTAVLIDEAYFDYYGESLVPDVAHHDNLLVARTFSKAYGLAGLRIGALIGSPQQIDSLRRLAAPFNVNAVALACLEEALADQEFMQAHVAAIRAERDRLQKFFLEVGLHCWHSQTNFVLVQVGEGSAAFVDATRHHGILIRDMSGSPGCEGCVRITIGTRDEMDQLIEAMKHVRSQAAFGLQRR